MDRTRNGLGQVAPGDRMVDLRRLDRRLAADTVRRGLGYRTVTGRLFQPKKTPAVVDLGGASGTATNLSDREKSVRTRVDHRRDRHARLAGTRLAYDRRRSGPHELSRQVSPRTLVGNASPRVAFAQLATTASRSARAAATGIAPVQSLKH